MRDLVSNVRTAIKSYDGYVYIPDLRKYMTFEVKQSNNHINTETSPENSEKIISNNPFLVV
jgi:hypothetical protein